MKALKSHVLMMVTCALIMGIGFSAYAKDNPSKGSVSTTAVKGGDGNKRAGESNKNQKKGAPVKAEGVISTEKMPDTVTNTKEGGCNPKDIASDRNQDEMSVTAGSATPVGQIQATGLKQVEELSCSVQEMRNSMMAIASKQEEFRKAVERCSLPKKGGGLGDVSPFVGAIVVILMLMVIVSVYWWLNYQMEETMEETVKNINRNSSGGAFSDEQINKMMQKIVEILPRSSGNGTQTYVNITRGQIDDIAGKVSEKLGLSKKLEDVVKMHFGTVAEKLAGSAGKMETLQSSVSTLGEVTSKITSGTEAFIKSLNQTKENFVEDVNKAKKSFCEEEAVSVLPDIHGLMLKLSEALTRITGKLQAEVEKLEVESKGAQETIKKKDEEIKKVAGERDAKNAELLAQSEAHKADTEKIDQLEGVIKVLRADLKKVGDEKGAAETSFEREQARCRGVEEEKGKLEKVIAKRDEWNQSLFPSWFDDQSIMSLHDALCNEFVSEAPSTECLLFRAALLELKAMELKGVPDGIESLLTRLGRYCFAYLSEKKCETKDMFEFGRRIATLVSESDMINPTGVYVRVPRMGGAVDLQWMKNPSNERTVQTIRTWSVWTTQNGLYSKAEVN